MSTGPINADAFKDALVGAQMGQLRMPKRAWEGAMTEAENAVRGLQNRTVFVGVRSIANGYVVSINEKEVYAKSLVEVGEATVALLAAHSMDQANEPRYMADHQVDAERARNAALRAMVDATKIAAMPLMTWGSP